ncbi:hypothetical protein Clacol_005126 [Clathrus columnatus]|uniref:Uncharacterized protein n=1 Tax=Clathrus columnatus TaxID=1419009 RepID=A0AAV5ACN4_9AGAM|nr:hypothetical protein Clacol_005126 [Clathrus columnatus]
MYPDRVLDLEGGVPTAGNPIICYPNASSENQLGSHWSVTYADSSKPSYWFQAVDPPSNIFASPVFPSFIIPQDAIVTGTPDQKIELQLFESGDEGRIVALSQDESEYLAFEAPAGQTNPYPLSSVQGAGGHLQPATVDIRPGI